MAITPLCTDSDLESMFSKYGVDAHTEDLEDGVRTTNAVGNAIEKASADVYHYLLRRYSVAVVSRSSGWVKWVAAVGALLNICRRRGNPPPQELVDDWNFYLAELVLIRDGVQPLIVDDGVATPAIDNMPGVSNLIVSNRYSRSRIRRVSETSSQNTQPGGLKRHDAPPPTMGAFGP